jgi:hypothetical protein
MLIFVLGIDGFVGESMGPPRSFPAVQAFQVDSTYGCTVCHAEKRRSFVLGVHPDRGVRCHDCHGGDPGALELPAGHRRPFVGQPSKLGTAQLCSTCHADLNQMRQYGLPADQLAEFRTSRHGRLLFQGNADAPTCTDCHDAHTILPPEDARSGVYPTNIPATCANCHEDQELMSRYEMEVDQLEQYRGGAHGIGLFEEQNFANPTCVDCHGSHAALPPATGEIVHVCDKCHVLVGRSLYRGPHGPPAASGEIPGCVACHSNHGTERVAPAAIASTCRECHEAQSRAALVGAEIQEQVVRATDDLAAAAEAIEELIAGGRDVAETRFRYQSLVTRYQQMGQPIHSLDLEELEDLGLRIGSISHDVQGAAEASVEHQWEHKLLLVPLWFLALAVVALSWFKFRDLKHGDR